MKTMPPNKVVHLPNSSASNDPFVCQCGNLDCPMTVALQRPNSMKAKKLLRGAFIEDHPGITDGEMPQYKELIGAGFEPIDGEQDHWQNCGDTVVLAVPDLNNAVKYDQIHEWITEHVNRCMKAVALLKPDEFDIQPLEGMKGYSHIMRLWWD